MSAPDAQQPKKLFFPSFALPWAALEYPKGQSLQPPGNTKALGFLMVYASREEAEAEHPGTRIVSCDVEEENLKEYESLISRGLN